MRNNTMTRQIERTEKTTGRSSLWRLPVVFASIFLVWSAAARNVDQPVTLDASGMPLKEVLRMIESQTGYAFAYNSSGIDMSRPVTVSVAGVSLKRALDKVLEGMPYIMVGKHIILKPVKKPAPEPEPEPQPETPPPPPPPPPLVTADFPPVLPSAAGPTPPEPNRLPRKSFYRAPRIDYPRATLRYPTAAVKTNVLALLATTLNLAGEVRVSDRMSAELSLAVNPWLFRNNYKTQHWAIRPEIRYWFDRPFSGHVVGLHVHYARYNVGHIGFLPGALADNRYRGSLFGAGVSYGYHWAVGRNTGIEPVIGAGINRMSHDRYLYTGDCCAKYLGREEKTAFSLTRIGVSVVYRLRYR